MQTSVDMDDDLDEKEDEEDEEDRKAWRGVLICIVWCLLLGFDVR